MDGEACFTAAMMENHSYTCVCYKRAMQGIGKHKKYKIRIPCHILLHPNAPTLPLSFRCLPGRGVKQRIAVGTFFFGCPAK